MMGLCGAFEGEAQDKSVMATKETAEKRKMGWFGMVFMG
jgi:hypothetical protein